MIYETKVLSTNTYIKNAVHSSDVESETQVYVERP
jgi:hypothetical protein